MKTIKHKDKKICNNCKYFQKRKNRGIGGGSGWLAGSLCYAMKTIVSKDSTCDKWEGK